MHMAEFKNKQDYEKWKAQGGSLIRPVKKGSSRLITGFIYAAVNTLLVVLLGSTPVFIFVWFFFGLLTSMLGIIIYGIALVATPIISIVTWLKKMEAECPSCNEIIQFSDSATGVTCKACRNRAVVKSGRLIKVS